MREFKQAIEVKGTTRTVKGEIIVTICYSKNEFNHYINLVQVFVDGNKITSMGFDGDREESNMIQFIERMQSDLLLRLKSLSEEPLNPIYETLDKMGFKEQPTETLIG